jgi:hypothetical protein
VRVLAKLEKELEDLERTAAKFTLRFEQATDKETEEIAWSKLRETLSKKKALDAAIAEQRQATAAKRRRTITLEETTAYLGLLKTQLTERSKQVRGLPHASSCKVWPAGSRI